MFRRDAGRDGSRGRSRSRRAAPAFEALESRQLLARTLPFLQGGNPGFRTITSGQAQYTVRLQGPGQMHLRPLGGGRFRFVAPTGGGAVGEVVHFVEQPGRPMRMYIGDGWIDRVP